MMSILWVLGVKIYELLQRYGPSNIVLRRLRTRAQLKWAALVGAAGVLVYGFIFLAVVDAVQHGATHWLYTVAAVAFWDAVKFLVVIPVSTAKLLVSRNQERRQLNQAIRDVFAQEAQHGHTHVKLSRSERRELLKATRA